MNDHCIVVSSLAAGYDAKAEPALFLNALLDCHDIRLGVKRDDDEDIDILFP